MARKFDNVIEGVKNCDHVNSIYIDELSPKALSVTQSTYRQSAVFYPTYNVAIHLTNFLQ